ncbi:MAG TPA: tetratricopeptide repeat protein [Oscillospiraceae bacterium]|nr:tetratricopeptide repeat protein [Oscillospiraceae bacterium]
MEISKKATLKSQLYDDPCDAEDTEQIFWLRQADDYKSRFLLGNALAAQYRFKEAAEAFESALRIKRDDPKLFYSLGGTYLTLRRFEEAKSAYDACLDLSIDEKFTALPMGFWHYLKGDYSSAAIMFEKCFPANDETAVAAIYWHTLSSLRDKTEAHLLKNYDIPMDVDHHKAYSDALQLLTNRISLTSYLEKLKSEDDDLNFSVLMYAAVLFQESEGQFDESQFLLNALLKRDKAWPSLPYLAAWGDTCNV